MKKEEYSILRTKSFITESKGTISDSLFTSENIDKQFKQEQLAYNTFGPLTNAVDSTAEIACKNFHLVGENLNYVQELDNIVQKFRLKEKLLSVFKRLEVFGNVFMFVKFRKGVGLVECKLLPTIGITINKDRYGNLKKPAYIQFEGSPNEETFNENEIIHFSLENIDSGAYGMSPVLPLLKDIQIYNQIRRQIPTIVQRYAAPMIHVKIGDLDKDIFPTQSDVDDWSRDLEDIYCNTEWVTGPEVEMNVLGFEGKTLDITGVQNMCRDDILMGLRVPREVLSLPEGSNKGQAVVTDEIYKTRIETYQRQVSIDLMEGLFKPHLANVFGEQILNEATNLNKKNDDVMNDEVKSLNDLPDIVWEIEDGEDEKEKILLIIQLKNQGLITLKKALELLPEEFRDEEGMAELVAQQAERDALDMEMKKNFSKPGNDDGPDKRVKQFDKNSNAKPPKFSKEWLEQDCTCGICEGKGSDRTLELPKDDRWVSGLISMEDKYSEFLRSKLVEAFTILNNNVKFIIEESSSIKEVKDINLKNVDNVFEKFMFDVRDQGLEVPSEAYMKGWEKAKSDLGVAISFNVPDYDTINFLTSKTSELLLTVSQELKGRVKTQIRMGVEGGESIRDIGKRLTGIEETYKNRLNTIARTEVSNAVNQARINAYTESGIVEKVEYLAALGACPICKPNDGKEFTLKESAGIIPAHPNCRCTWSPIV